jgi:hypothetical protein
MCPSCGQQLLVPSPRLQALTPTSSAAVPVGRTVECYDCRYTFPVHETVRRSVSVSRTSASAVGWALGDWLGGFAGLERQEPRELCLRCNEVRNVRRSVWNCRLGQYLGVSLGVILSIPLAAAVHAAVGIVVGLLVVAAAIVIPQRIVASLKGRLHGLYGRHPAIPRL